MAQTTVGELSVAEFRHLVKQIVAETLAELMADPDEGLELQEGLQARLRKSLDEVRGSVRTQSAQELATQLGLESRSLQTEVRS